MIAGPDDDPGWLTEARTSGVPIAGGARASQEQGGLGFDDLLARVGRLLKGRRTYDAVRAMDVPWPYGDLPVHVASHHPLEFDERSLASPNPAPSGGVSATPASVCAVTGTIGEVIADALAAAAGKDVYVDGGFMVRSTLAAGLLDDLVTRCSRWRSALAFACLTTQCLAPTSRWWMSRGTARGSSGSITAAASAAPPLEPRTPPAQHPPPAQHLR